MGRKVENWLNLKSFAAHCGVWIVEWNETIQQSNGGRPVIKNQRFLWRGARSSTNQLFLLSLIKESKDICFIDGGEESCWRAALPARSIAAPSRAVWFVFIPAERAGLICLCCGLWLGTSPLPQHHSIPSNKFDSIAAALPVNNQLPRRRNQPINKE